MTDVLYSPSGRKYHNPHLGHTVLRCADGRLFRGQLQHVTDRGMAVILAFAIHGGLMWADLGEARLMLVWRAEVCEGLAGRWRVVNDADWVVSDADDR